MCRNKGKEQRTFLGHGICRDERYKSTIITFDISTKCDIHLLVVLFLLVIIHMMLWIIVPAFLSPSHNANVLIVHGNTMSGNIVDSLMMQRRRI